ncbi:hypothetical protein AB8615_07090 [Litorimonas sp. RW-G-Af-16]|uniref:hypothetical protein n=1 Tax=Litorimonas sp. RW-G-Af-16 TaxID=3241168 RepID=UPI003AAD5853
MSEQTPGTQNEMADAAEPSMEDILASIRKIIADDDTTALASPEDIVQDTSDSVGLESLVEPQSFQASTDLQLADATTDMPLSELAAGAIAAGKEEAIALDMPFDLEESDSYSDVVDLEIPEAEDEGVEIETAADIPSPLDILSDPDTPEMAAQDDVVDDLSALDLVDMEMGVADDPQLQELTETLDLDVELETLDLVDDASDADLDAAPHDHAFASVLAGGGIAAAGAAALAGGIRLKRRATAMHWILTSYSPIWPAIIMIHRTLKIPLTRSKTTISKRWPNWLQMTKLNRMPPATMKTKPIWIWSNH